MIAQAELATANGEHAQALETLDQAQALLTSGEPLAAWIQAAACRAARLAGDPDRARALLAATLAAAKIADRRIALALNLAAAREAAALEDRETARTAALAAADLARQEDNQRALSAACGQLGGLAELAGETDAAMRFTRQAMFAAQQASAPELLYRWNWQLGRLYLSAGDRQKARQMLEAATAGVEPIRRDIAAALWRRNESYRAELGPLFYDLAGLYLQDGASEADLNRALQLIERFKSHELEDYFRDDCVSVAQCCEPSLGTLAGDDAVLYIVPLANRTELLLGVGGALHHQHTDVTNAELTETVDTFRRNLETRTNQRYLKQAQVLYDWLLRPLEPLLTGVRTLVLVPDGPLRTIPISALHDGERFVISKFATAVVPALSLFDTSDASDERSPRALLNGLSEAVQGFPALPFVEGELNTIDGLFKTTKLYNESFRTAAVEAQMHGSSYQIVHIASHGEFTGQADKSFLLTWDSRLTLDRLEALIRPFRHHGHAVELLTLSACRTAVGDERAALGLAGVAVKAGARSALATLWYVNDQASADLVADFYHQLHDYPEGGKSVALQHAQVAIAEQRRYRHPFYWAPFLIIGNWH